MVILIRCAEHHARQYLVRIRRRLRRIRKIALPGDRKGRPYAFRFQATKKTPPKKERIQPGPESSTIRMRNLTTQVRNALSPGTARGSESSIIMISNLPDQVRNALPARAYVRNDP